MAMEESTRSIHEFWLICVRGRRAQRSSFSMFRREVWRSNMRWSLRTYILVSTIGMSLDSRADSVNLSIKPATQTVIRGSSVSVGLEISGLGNGTALGVFDLNIGFDSTLLSFSGAVFGDP